MAIRVGRADCHELRSFDTGAIECRRRLIDDPVEIPIQDVFGAVGDGNRQRGHTGGEADETVEHAITPDRRSDQKRQLSAARAP